MAIDLTDTEHNSDRLSHDLVQLSNVNLLPVPSCFVCDGHFAFLGPSRYVLQCCSVPIHLQCIADLVHKSSQSVTPVCNAQSPSFVDFLHFQHLCYVHHLGAPAGECMICSGLQALLPSAHPLRVPGSVNPFLRRPLPLLHTGPRPPI